MKYLWIVIALGLIGCASAPQSQSLKSAPQASELSPPPQAPTSDEPRMLVFYGEPNLKYKKICKIEASGSNVAESRFTRKSDFEPQFRRRARRCRGANAVIISNMFAFEKGSAFADGTAIHIEGP